MNFPQFGDAGIYSEIGAACASPLTSAQGSAFLSCYSPIRPVGMVALSTLPFLVTRDPLEVAYVALTLNLVLSRCAAETVPPSRAGVKIDGSASGPSPGPPRASYDHG